MFKVGLALIVEGEVTDLHKAITEKRNAAEAVHQKTLEQIVPLFLRLAHVVYFERVAEGVVPVQKASDKHRRFESDLDGGVRRTLLIKLPEYDEGHS